MASAWLEKRPTRVGDTRWCVRFRVGGRDSVPQRAGTFRTQRDALARKAWVLGELAAMRVPNVEHVAPARVETLKTVGDRWRASRVDVAKATAITHRTNLGRILRELGDRPVDAITPPVVAELVAALHGDGMARESIRKTLATFAMILDFAGVAPNPARDRGAVKLPREDRAEVNPPTAKHVLAVHHLLVRALRLPLLTLDATGMRVGELAGLTWGDVDEPEGRWRVSQAVAKTRRARWVPVHPDAFQAVVDSVPREDRDLEAPVFAGFGVDRFRTAISRACKAAGIPVFSPHDLRHRRATLWHLQGVPIADAAAWLGHSPSEHLATYAHATLVDRDELTYPDLLERARTVHTSVPPDRKTRRLAGVFRPTRGHQQISAASRSVKPFIGGEGRAVIRSHPLKTALDWRAPAHKWLAGTGGPVRRSGRFG
jgi:integrase